MRRPVPPYNVPLIDQAGQTSTVWWDFFARMGRQDKQIGLIYSASITFDASAGDMFVITATNGTAFTINAPASPINGMVITVRIRNTSGGALGVITWNAVFKMPAFTSPGNGNSRAVTFDYDGANWVQRYQSAADVPN